MIVSPLGAVAKITAKFYNSANNRTAEKNDTFTTQHAETTDAHGNRWIQIPEGFIATHYNRTIRATIEVI